MSDLTQTQEMELQVSVGELLARGNTSGEILESLVSGFSIEPEDAAIALRRVYDSWITTRESLNLQAEDDRNWHRYLRMRLLRDTLQDTSIIAKRLALRILDSLAAIQGITTVTEQTTPLPIILVEKQPEVDVVTENTNGTE